MPKVLNSSPLSAETGVILGNVLSEIRLKTRFSFPKKSSAVALGAQKSDKTSQNSESPEEFLAGLRFEHRGKLALVPIKL